ncbi:hypothetical protein [Bradyrhizobium sp. SZCCHNS1054]|uniref:hypothetical protein n=1 Tax=Bradyrhizobium sp. SZCCHNS1054 TaxID=3057301 RepID=UPI002916C98E|nr:hypothetical protein [Bradyrhizobium sp. SZCCHNS1054]
MTIPISSGTQVWLATGADLLKRFDGLVGRKSWTYADSGDSDRAVAIYSLIQTAKFIDVDRQI